MSAVTGKQTNLKKKVHMYKTGLKMTDDSFSKGFIM